MSLIIFFEENIKQYRTVFPIFLILAEDPPGFIEALNGVKVRLEDTNHILRSNIFKKNISKNSILRVEQKHRTFCLKMMQDRLFSFD